MSNVIWKRLPFVLILVCLASIALPPVASAQRKSEANTDAGLFELCQGLEPRASREQWRTALAAVKQIQALVESTAADSPLASPKKLADWEDKLTMPLPPDGAHSRWKAAKYVGHRPPDGPSGSYIYGSLAVLNGPLIRRLPAASDPSEQLRPKSQHWSGYIHNAIAVVHGGINIDGYISDSIVIAAGPIEIDGHISNSIVISLASKEELGLKMEDGYSSHSLLVARRAQVGSFRSSTLIGKLISNDLRGGRFIIDDEIHAKLLDICKPAADARLSPNAEAKEKFQPPTSADLLAKLLATEQDSQAAVLADLLAEFQLSDEQVQQLIESAESTTSSKRRNSLWHAIRLSKSKLGRDYLMEKFVHGKLADDELIVEFLDTITNLSSYDTKLLIGIYSRLGEETQRARETDSPGKLLSLEQHVVRIATTPWQEFCTDWNRYDRVLFSLDKDENSWNRRQVRDRRDEQAERGQYQILLWMVKHGREDEHRIAALLRGMSRGEWVKHGADHVSRQALVDGLLASSNRPEFRARVIPIIARYQSPDLFLGPEEDEIVRVAAITTLLKEFEKTRLDGRYSQRTRTLKALAEKAADDESEKVRAIAERILQELSRSQKP